MDKGKLTIDFFISVYSIIFLYFLKISEITDKRVSNLFLLNNVLYLLGRITGISKFFEIFHVIFALIMVIIPIIVRDRNIMFCHYIGIILIMTTRKLFKKCILRSFEKKNNIITNNKLSKTINWDYIYPGVALLSGYRLYRN